MSVDVVLRDRQHSTVTMPVVSSHRFTSSSAAATSSSSTSSYHRGISSYHHLSTGPRVSSYNPITITARKRSESREPSITATSTSTSSVLGLRRVSDVTRRLSYTIDPVEDLRQKYSPSNYTPNIRKSDVASRSGSDIGGSRSQSLTTSSLAPRVTGLHNRNKVNQVLLANNSVSVSAATNVHVKPPTSVSTNTDNDLLPWSDDDDNGNKVTTATKSQSVSEIRKMFDRATTTTTTTSIVTSTSTSTSTSIITTNRNNNVRWMTSQQPSSTVNNHTSNYASYIPVVDTSTPVVAEEEEEVADADVDVATTTSRRANDSDLSSSTSPQHLNHRNLATSPASNGSSSLSSSTSPVPGVTSTAVVRSLGLNGLRNIGNTCFMNSVIQCLSNTRPLLEYLRDSVYLNHINTTTSSMKGALVKAFAHVIQELWSSDSDKIVNTQALKSQIQRFAPRFMGYAQQDAQEFLRYLLEGLHEDVNRVTTKPTPILTEIDDNLSDAQKAAEAWNRYLRMDNSSIVDIFVGQLKSTLKCSVCGYCSVTFDPFWDLSLPLAGPASIIQCLENFTREEVLDGHEKPTCSKCQQRRKCTKSFSIQKFPKILVLHLKRFSPTERFRGKLTTLVDFPLHGLDLSAFAANRGGGSVQYNLYAISNHSGTTYSGHYTAYCKHPYSPDWHEYNDSRVSSITAKNVVSSEAYVLFYEQTTNTSHL